MKFEKTTIDSHIHLYNWFHVDGDDYFQKCDELQQALGLKGMCINCMTDPIYGGVENNIMAALYKLHNPTAYAHGAIAYSSYPISLPFPEGMDPLTQYRELMEIGFDGIKFLYKPDVQKLEQLPLDHAVYAPLFAQMEKDGTHITWHVADPAEFWSTECNRRWNYADGTYPLYEDMMDQTYNILEKHPQLTATFAHFMFLSQQPELLEKLFAKYPNMAIDVTPGVEMYLSFNERYDFYRAFFERYADRILFGSDAGIPKYNTNIELVKAVYLAMTGDEEVEIWKYPARGLQLSDKSCRLILHDNFVRRSGSQPKPVDREALVRYVRKYLHLIRNEEKKEQILRKIEEWEC